METIVIVGGGSIGLCTAYNLARSFSISSTKVRIIVVEFFDKPFAAASSQSTGCFHYGFPETESQPLLPLGKYSFDLWEAHAENEDFKRKTGYRAHSVLGVNSGVGRGIEALPDWIQTRPTWDIDQEFLGSRNATVNPSGIGEWLAAQCYRLGVEVETGLEVLDASLSPENDIQAVTCLTKDQTTVRIDCTKLLLACGPWTPTMFKKLFPSSPILLSSSISAGDWILYKNPCPTIQKSVAFVSFNGIVGEKLEFAGRNDGTIWVCGRKNLTASLPPLGFIAEPDERMIKDLTDSARTFLNWNCRCAAKHVGELQIVNKGRAFRPTTKSGLPVISEVIPSDLTSVLASTFRGLKSSSTVFVCWGHGSYGLTLGMGTGKVMSQLIRGEKPDLDLSLFALGQKGNAVRSYSFSKRREENL